MLLLKYSGAKVKYDLHLSKLILCYFSFFLNFNLYLNKNRAIMPSDVMLGNMACRGFLVACIHMKMYQQKVCKSLHIFCLR